MKDTSAQPIALRGDLWAETAVFDCVLTKRQDGNEQLDDDCALSKLWAETYSVRHTA